MLTFADPGYWASQPRELQEALDLVAGGATEFTVERGLGAGAIAPGPARLTLTVEEAAQVLGISRAFAYESVKRGDIPHIKIGRRILIPITKLEELLSSAPMPDDPR